jgi:hypothetical protein
LAAERDDDGRRLVVRNGYHQSRAVLTSAGAVQVTVARVNDKRADPGTGQRIRFSSAILPPWARKTPKVTEVLPLLYLHGLLTMTPPGQAERTAHSAAGGAAGSRVPERDRQERPGLERRSEATCHRARGLTAVEDLCTFHIS